MDPVDQAIAATQQPEPMALQQVGPITITSTGRPAVLAVPPDLTDDELLELASWLLNPGGLRAMLRRTSPASRIVLPT